MFEKLTPLEERWALPECEGDDAKVPQPPNHEEVTAQPAACVGVKLKVRKYDLDMNSHVNNVTYVKWLLEELPAECDTSMLRELDIEFRVSETERATLPRDNERPPTVRRGVAAACEAHRIRTAKRRHDYSLPQRGQTGHRSLLRTAAVSG